MLGATAEALRQVLGDAVLTPWEGRGEKRWKVYPPGKKKHILIIGKRTCLSSTFYLLIFKGDFLIWISIFVPGKVYKPWKTNGWTLKILGWEDDGLFLVSSRSFPGGLRTETKKTAGD